MVVHAFLLFLPLIFGWDSDTATSFNFTYYFTGVQDETLKTVAYPLINDAYSEIGVDLNFYPDSAIPVFIRNDTGHISRDVLPVWNKSGNVKIVIPGQDLRLGGDPIFFYRPGKEEYRNTAYYHGVLERRIRRSYMQAMLQQKIKVPMPGWFRAGIITYEEWGGAGLSGTEKQLLNRPPDDYPPLSSINPVNTERDYSLASALVKDFFSFLVNKYGKFNIQELLRRLSTGTPFDDAIEDVYMTDVEYLEEDWKFDRDLNYSRTPALR